MPVGLVKKVKVVKFIETIYFLSTEKEREIFLKRAFTSMIEHCCVALRLSVGALFGFSCMGY